MPAWEGLLQPEGSEIVAPWLGGPHVWTRTRRWQIRERPHVHGWYRFKIDRRVLVQPAPIDAVGDWFAGMPSYVALAVGSRAWLFAGQAGIVADLAFPAEALFSRVRVVRHADDRAYVVETLLDEDADVHARAALVSGLDVLPHASGVTPQHRAAFDLLVARRREVQQAREVREAARQRAEALKADGPEARRQMTRTDVGAALAAALRVSGAALLGWRPDGSGSLVVDYTVDAQPLQCVVARDTLAVLDAGICLQDHAGYRGDRELSLEALPSVVREAQRTRRLVVFRHVADVGNEEEEWDD
jgi:hypothetical protein